MSIDNTIKQGVTALLLLDMGSRRLSQDWKIIWVLDTTQLKLAKRFLLSVLMVENRYFAIKQKVIKSFANKIATFEIHKIQFAINQNFV